MSIKWRGHHIFNRLTPPKVSADDTFIGPAGIMRVDHAGGGGNKDVTLDEKVHVVDAWVVLEAAGTTSDTVAINNAGNAITDAMDISGADKSIVRASTIDDAQREVAIGGTLRVAQVDGGGSDAPALTAYILVVRV